jgi:hypothetical protein
MEKRALVVVPKDKYEHNDLAFLHSVFAFAPLSAKEGNVEHQRDTRHRGLSYFNSYLYYNLHYTGDTLLWLTEHTILL